MYFFKQRKLDKLNKKKEKLTFKLKHSVNEAEKSVLKAKIRDVDDDITRVTNDINGIDTHHPHI